MSHVFICYMNSFINQIHVFILSLCLSYAGTNNQKKELFVMAVALLLAKHFLEISRLSHQQRSGPFMLFIA
jgi:hypothetical protein